MATIHTTFLNYAETGPQLEVFDLKKFPSMTVPDQTLTLEELLQRHAQGREIPLHQGHYQDEDDYFVPDIKMMDMSEVYLLAQQNQEEIARLRAKAQKEYEDSLPKPPAPAGPQVGPQGDRPPESGGQNSTNPS